MWILDYSTIDVAELRQQAAKCSGASEIYIREDDKGSLIISDGPQPARGSNGRQVIELFDGGRFGSKGGDWLFCVGLWTPGDYRQEFLAWYEVEHLPMLLECSSWDGCRFVEEKVQKGCQFYAMHQLSDKAALDSDARKRSRATPWFKRLASNTWFDGAFSRTLLKRVP